MKGKKGSADYKPNKNKKNGGKPISKRKSVSY